MNRDGTLTDDEFLGKSRPKDVLLTDAEFLGAESKPSLWQRANTPLVAIPMVDEDTGIDAATGKPFGGGVLGFLGPRYAIKLENKGRELAGSFTSPVGVALLAAGPSSAGLKAAGAVNAGRVAEAIASVASAGIGVEGVVRSVPELVKANNGPDRLAAALDTFISTGMVVGGAAGMADVAFRKSPLKGRSTADQIAKDDAETRAVVGESAKDETAKTGTLADAMQQERGRKLTEAADFWASMDIADPRVEQLVRDNYKLTDAEMELVRGDLGAAIYRIKSQETTNAIRQPSAEEILQRQQEEAASAGSGRGRVEPKQPGAETADAGAETKAEPPRPDEAATGTVKAVEEAKPEPPPQPAEAQPEVVPKAAESSVAPMKPTLSAAEQESLFVPSKGNAEIKSGASFNESPVDSAPAAVTDPPKSATAVMIDGQLVKAGKSEPILDVMQRLWKDAKENIQNAKQITFGTMRGNEFRPMEETGTAATRAAIDNAKARVRKSYDNAKKMGAVSDPKEIAKNNLEMYEALFDLATNYIKLGVQTAAEFAARMGLKLTNAIERAFNDAKAGKKSLPTDTTTKIADDIKSGVEKPRSVEKNIAAGRTEATKPVVEAMKSSAPYEAVSIRQMNAKAKGMTDLELSGVRSDDPMYLAAKAEAAERLDKAGKTDEAVAKWNELAAEATVMGQQNAYLKVLYSKNPYYYVRQVSRTMVESGFEPLTKAKKTTLKNLVEEAKKSQEALDDATEKYGASRSEEDYAAMEKASNASQKAEVELQVKTAAMMPRSVWGTLKAAMQGNLIAPISQVANVVGNVSFTPFRSTSRGIATVVDVLDSFITGHDRQVSVLSPSKVAGNLVNSFPKSARTAAEIMRKGTGAVIKGEERQGLHPLKAWRDMATQAAEMPTVNGKLTVGQKAEIWVQRTFGMPAEPMLRMLAGMDVMAREPAWRNIVTREASIRTLKGEPAPISPADIAKAIRFPELFFKPEIVRRMRAEADYAVFQRQSQTVKMLNGWMHRQGPFADFMYATIAPFKLTPWNIIGEIFSYNPMIALAESGRNGLKVRSLTNKAANLRNMGDVREADIQQSLADAARYKSKVAAGKLVVGTMMTGAAWYLYKKGILSPSYDASDETNKTRIQAGDILPPNHINLSALGRLLDGKDTAPRSGDTTMDVFRAGGLAGAFFYMAANIGRDMERSRDSESESVALSILRDSTLEMGRYGINQSFLKGVSGLLQSFRDGRADQMLQNWINGVVSIPLPNTLAAVSRATRDYKPDTKPERFMDNFTHAVQNRLGGVMGQDKDMPLKLDVWGRPMEETPAGRSAFWYHFADVFKFQQASDSPLDLEVYKLARKTGSVESIPSIPAQEIRFARETYKLDRDQYAQMVTLIGEQRRKFAEVMVTNPNFQSAPDTMKLKLLQRMYEAGERTGRAMFIHQLGNPSTLEKKPARTGFESM